MKRREKQIADLVEPTVQALGLELWGVEHFSQGRHSVLRIYIDSAKGVDIDDCARVSQQVSGILDVEDPISTEYTLEVSSPGADRRLFSREQFEQFAGNQVNVRLKTPQDGRRNFKGLLSGVKGDGIRIEVDEGEIICPIDEIEKANILSGD